MICYILVLALYTYTYITYTYIHIHTRLTSIYREAVSNVFRNRNHLQFTRVVITNSTYMRAILQDAVMDQVIQSQWIARIYMWHSGYISSLSDEVPIVLASYVANN